MPVSATLLPELALAAQTGARYIAGVDEVGRGALAGPVTIGVTAIDLTAEPFTSAKPSTGVCEPLDGVRDSKLLTSAARARWVPIIREHISACAVKHRQPEEIDALGITEAMRRAAAAALDAVESSLGHPLDVVILDGSHDWLTRGASERVHTMIKADQKSLTTAAASVLAKVERDLVMEDLSSQYPGYGWESNRGYASSQHRAALGKLGVTAVHRQSWNLGVELGQDGPAQRTRRSSTAAAVGPAGPE